LKKVFYKNENPYNLNNLSVEREKNQIIKELVVFIKISISIFYTKLGKVQKPPFT
jgi:hypothetical protein